MLLTWTEVLIILVQALYVGLVSCRDAHDKKIDLRASETPRELPEFIPLDHLVVHNSATCWQCA